MSITKVTFSMIQGAVVNVLDYGAIGDGTFDNATAFNLAITSLTNGGVVYIPTGQYKVSSTIILNDNITIVGEDTATVILGNTSSDNSDSVNGLFCAKNKSNVILSNLKIIPFTGSNDIRSKFILCNNVQIKNCYLDGDLTTGDISSYPIWIAGCTNAKVINHTSYNFRDHVYICKSNWDTGVICEQVDVVDSHFENTNLGTTHAYPTGVYTYFGNYTNVYGCTFKNIAPSLAGAGYTGYGIYEGDGQATEVNVKNCNFQLTVSSPGNFVGCVSSTTTNFNVIGCSFNGTSTYKIHQGVGFSAIHTLVDSCSFNNCEYGVFLIRVLPITYENWTVTNNNFFNIEFGIRISAATAGAKNVVISNNNINTCKANGILFNSLNDYSIVCSGNLIRNANTQNSASEPFDSAINIFGANPTGILSNNFVINESGVGYARYGINIANPDYALTVTNTNSFSNMITGGVRNNQIAPTTGTWVQGDTRWNWNATSGQPMGWVCTVSGTPGTWKAMSNLA